MNTDMKRELYTIEKDIKIFCVKASSFPEGIMDAHEKIHTMVPFSATRRYVGISRPEQGSIVYKAGAEAVAESEAEKYVRKHGCEEFVIQAGTYVSVLVHDFRNNNGAIKEAFDLLRTEPNIDPQGYCLELYTLTGTDVRCLIPLKN